MDELRALYEDLKDDVTDHQVETTVNALIRRQYSPILILSVPDFFRFRKADMLAELDRVMNLSDDSGELRSVVGLSSAEEVKRKHLCVLLHQYQLLCGLRRNNGDAWAVVNELYEDD